MNSMPTEAEADESYQADHPAQAGHLEAGGEKLRSRAASYSKRTHRAPELAGSKNIWGYVIPGYATQRHAV